MTDLKLKWPKTPTCFTKTLDPADYTLLPIDLELVDSVPLGDQHQHRRWEYAMCLRAIRTWDVGRGFHFHDKVSVLDIGGAGSPLSTIITSKLGHTTTIIDPRTGTGTIEEHQPAPADVVISISTIEHVPDEVRFVRCLADAVKPGGLLFLTTDVKAGGATGLAHEDICHFHWMRSRIYTVTTWRALGRLFLAKDFHYFGPPDWHYHGDHVYDYSFASMALVKGKL